MHQDTGLRQESQDPLLFGHDSRDLEHDGPSPFAPQHAKRRSLSNRLLEVPEVALDALQNLAPDPVRSPEQLRCGMLDRGIDREKRIGDQLQSFPRFLFFPLRAGKGVRQKLIGTVKRKNGRLQVTYNGWPLYYYVGDTSPGAISCQNVNEYGGLWLVVSPAGKLIR